MKKKDVDELILKNKAYTKETEEIIQAINEARDELESARCCFQYVKDPRLIDYAIYKEAAARSKFIYYILKAKEKGIVIGSYESLLKKASDRGI